MGSFCPRRGGGTRTKLLLQYVFVFLFLIWIEMSVYGGGTVSSFSVSCNDMKRNYTLLIFFTSYV